MFLLPLVPKGNNICVPKKPTEFKLFTLKRLCRVSEMLITGYTVNSYLYIHKGKQGFKYTEQKY